MKREAWIAPLFACLAALPFLGKAWHVDEMLYLPAARHILQDPFHPYDFLFNWYGRTLPYTAINNTPPVIHYALALALKVTGGAEVPMRLFFLPFDVAAALGLYLLAGRFLAKPLLPTLIVIASPAYWLNMGQLMAEKPVAAFGFLGLYALVRGVDDEDRRWYWASAGLLGAALFSKYLAVLFLAPAAAYALSRGVPRARVAGHLALSCLPLAAYFLFDRMTNRAAVGAALLVTGQSFRIPTGGPVHRIRALLAFLGGCGAVTAFWPWFARPASRRALIAVLAATTLLFLPWLDIAPLVRPVDRLTGIVFASAGLWGLLAVLAERSRARGGPIWAALAASVVALLLAYWCVLSRLALFAVPAFVFGAAEAFEAVWPEERRRRFYLASLTGTALLSSALAVVDYAYADAQRTVAREVAAPLVAEGRRVWFTGHWGLQDYMERAGARALDLADGGWDAARPGDVVIVPQVNTNVLQPRRPLPADARTLTIPFAIPLRLISGWTGEGGFYASTNGFLPFSLSWEPLEEFRFIELK